MPSPQVCAVSYSRVSSDRQDVDLSVSGQQRAVRDWAIKNGYELVGEYVDEAESGRVDSRDGFSRMIHDACLPNPKFKTILVWKHDRFSRRQEHAVVYKARLRDCGVRLVSISEPLDDTPSGRLMEAIIEGLVEYYSENLSEDVARGMREAALRGNFFGARAPFGYKKVKVQGSDGRMCSTLDVDPIEAATVLYIFRESLDGKGVKEIGKDLSDQGITNRGRRWVKTSLDWVLTNEACVGTLVWGRRPTRTNAPPPVRVESAWPGIVPREMFAQVQEALAKRAPDKERSRPRPTFLLRGLLQCGICNRPYMVQGAKGGRYFYYVCSTLHRLGAGTCQSSYLNAEVTDNAFLRRLTALFTTPESFPWIAASVTADINSTNNDYASVLDQVKTALEEVERRLESTYDLVESQSPSLETVVPSVSFLRSRREQLRTLRKEVLRTIRQIDQMATRYSSSSGEYGVEAMVEEFRACLEDSSVLEKRALIELLIDRIVVLERGEFDIQTTVPLSLPFPD